MRTAESVLLTCWPPGARRAIGVDAQVGGIDVDDDRIVDFRIDEDAGERRVPPRVGVERALAHEPVHAHLGAQEAVGVVALDLDRRALDARDFAVGLFQHIGAVALALAIAQVHAHQHRRPVLRLGAAAAGLDVDEAVGRVERLVEHPPEFEVVDDLGDLRDVTLDGAYGGVVALGPRQAEQLGAVGQVRRAAASASGPRLRAASFPGPVPARAAGSSQIFGSSSSFDTAP